MAAQARSGDLFAPKIRDLFFRPGEGGRAVFRPSRYKVAYGGRGSAKSWGFARAILLLGTIRPLRVLCAREVQKSIKQSVHQLLKDQIEALGLGRQYEVLETQIRGANGTQIDFTGLSTHTSDSIKSFEGVDICWVEEAQAVVKRSWDILTPTIRKTGSEIWLSLNPELDTDETYRRFIESPPAGAAVVLVNWRDNPWFTTELEAERQNCLRFDPKSYDNIWEGKPRAAVEGAIYADEIAEAQTAGRVRDVPYDPMLKVHLVFDLGFNDSMAIGMVQRGPSDIRLIDYIEDSHKTLDWYSATLRERRWNWGSLWLPHDGEHKDYKSGKSAQQILQALGWDVQIVPRGSIEDGIKVARMAFPRAYFDREKTERLRECLKRYKRHIAATTDEPSRPVHDEFSHGADMFRYMAQAESMMTNEEWGGALKYPTLNYA
jgi:phage terminase large subunit